MDDPNLHGDDELLEDIGADDELETPEDTELNDDSDEPNQPNEQAKEAQKNAWVRNIREGKKTLEDMPEHLNWLKPDVEKEVKPKITKQESKSENLTRQEVRQMMREDAAEQRAKEQFEFLLEDLEGAKLDANTGQMLKDEYLDLIDSFSDPESYRARLKALNAARKLAGLKDYESLAQDRRSKMSIPVSGGRRRQTVIREDDPMTQAEKELSGNLPPGFEI